MHKFLTEETPAKVLSLLGAALFSLTFLFGVTQSDASFAQMYRPLPDPFGPKAVMPAVDRVAAAYSNYVTVALLNPTKQDFADASQQVAWLWDNSKEDLAYATGLDGLLSSSHRAQGSVAGAYTSVASDATVAQASSFNIDTVYNVLLR